LPPTGPNPLGPWCTAHPQGVGVKAFIESKMQRRKNTTTNTMQFAFVCFENRHRAALFF